MESSEAEARFRELFDRHHRALSAYFLRRIPDRSDAFDATEEVFLVAWRRLDSVPQGEAALLWLYGVARKVLANHRRGFARRLRLRARVAAEPVIRPEDPSSDQALIDIDAERLRNALSTLRQSDRDVLLLTYWEQLSHEDVGRVLGCSTEAVHVRRYRALKRLRNAYRLSGQEEIESRASVQGGADRDQ